MKILNGCRGLRPVLYVLVLLSLPGRAWAGYLTINGISALQARTEGGAVVISGTYEIENKGDETATGVFPAFQLGAWTWTGEPKTLDAGNKAAWRLNERFDVSKLECGSDPACAGLTLPTAGRHPLFVRRYYQDVNGYRYSAAQVQDIIVGDLTTEQLAAVRIGSFDGTMECSGNGQDFDCALRYRNTTPAAHRVAMSYYPPRELKIAAQPLVIEAAGNSEGAVPFELNNSTGLAGSSYAVFAVLQWEESGVRNFLAPAAQLRIERPSHRNLFLTTGAVAVLLVLALLYFGVYRKKRA